ncbi:MAG: histidine ammonia-lyase [bacterium]|nr:histidine ammonia-lyase [bacterium]
MSINGSSLRLEEFEKVVFSGAPVKLTETARTKLRNSRQVVEEILIKGDPVYGVNTGFGLLSNVNISPEKVEELQLNLIRSHASGAGEMLPEPVVRGTLLLLINGLSGGHSGCREVVVDTMISMLNKGIVPIIPEQGSLGASGDLIPLSHLALVLIGEGEAVIDGRKYSGRTAMKRADIEPLTLKAKEGLSLNNGTYVMASLGAISLIRSIRLARLADMSAAMTIEVTMSSKGPMQTEIHKLKPHRGQLHSAKNILKLIKGSGLIKSHKGCDVVQDAYSIRCVPQVHGAARDVIDYCRKVIETEINSSTDNPLILGSRVVSAGNFHGEALAISLDSLALGVTSLGNIAERRISRLVDPNLSGLPAFLTPDPGLNSGLMMPHYLAAALTLENRGLSTPASVESVPTSANKEDYISNGMWSARKALNIVENVENLLAIEMLCSAQAKEFYPNLMPGKGTKIAYKTIRNKIPPLENDRFIQKDILKLAEMIRDNTLLEAVESETGSLN